MIGVDHWLYLDLFLVQAISPLFQPRRVVFQLLPVRGVVGEGGDDTFLVGSTLVVVGKVAIFTQAFGVVSLTSMGTKPGFLCAATSMVTIDAHTFGIVSLIGMWAVGNLPLTQIVVRARDTRHNGNIFGILAFFNLFWI